MGWPKGKKQSEVHKRKIGKALHLALKGKKRSYMVGNTYGHKNLGMKRSADTKKSISESLKGQKRSEDTKKRMSKAKLKMWKNPEIANKIQSKLHNTSYPESQVGALLHKLKLLPGSFRYNGNGEAKIHIDGLTPDFISARRKLIIEVQGQHWHSDQIQNKTRLNRLYTAGYSVLEIWDYDLRENFDYDTLAERIRRGLK